MLHWPPFYKVAVSGEHYSDVIMSAMASQIVGVSIVCSSVCSGADQRIHQSLASLAFVRGIHRSPMDSPHKASVTREIFPFNGVIMNDHPARSQENSKPLDGEMEILHPFENWQVARRLCCWATGQISIQWRHNDHDGVSNHQPHGCLLNRLFRRRSKKTPKLRVTGLCVGNSPGPVNSPHKGPVTRKTFPDDVFKCIFFNENVSISIKISLKFVPKGAINNTSALAQIMAWRRPGDKSLSEPPAMMVSLPTHICVTVTRPQWVDAYTTTAMLA